jgi:RNA polymerase sigma factor (sigma-70 family)
MLQARMVSSAVTVRPIVALYHVNPNAFDPAALAQRQQLLERRLAIAVQRMGEARLIDRLRPSLTAGTAAELFVLLADDDRRVATAAHECAMLRFSYVVAVVAQSMAFDVDRRDDLVQRTFLNLPQIVRRSIVNGVGIPNPEGWIAYRAHLIACQMFREERGNARRDANGRLTHTRGRRVPVEALDEAAVLEENTILAALDDAATRAQLETALDRLALEQPIGARVLRLHYFNGESLDEIARTIGRSHGTVRNDASKARARLAAIIRAHHAALWRDQSSGVSDVAG